MDARMAELLRTVAEELDLTEDSLLQRGLRGVLERRLREVRAEILEIRGRYGVTDAADMDSRYRRGALEEADPWRDLQRLDQLMSGVDHLLALLRSMEDALQGG